MKNNPKRNIYIGGTVLKNLPANARDAGDVGTSSESGRSPGVGNGTPLQYSCLENSMDRGVWPATNYGMAKSQIRQQLHFHFHAFYERYLVLLASVRN